jgi:hypothetical protein
VSDLLLLMHCKVPSSANSIKVWVANAVSLIMKKILYICRHPKYEVLCSVSFFLVVECMRSVFLAFNKDIG